MDQFSNNEQWFLFASTRESREYVSRLTDDEIERCLEEVNRRKSGQKARIKLLVDEKLRRAKKAGGDAHE